jgi:hypothetical protein
MNIKYKSKKGDISLLVTLLVCSIILILLAPLAQKVSVEARISRENLMSQQAVQASKTGLDAWVDNFTKGNIDYENQFGQQNWPNNTYEGLRDGNFIILDNDLGIQYQVKFEKAVPTSIPPQPARLISTGRVKKGNFTIERTLEDTREGL